MQTLFRQGAFKGRTLREAYFVERDIATTIHDGVCRSIVIVKVRQMAGHVETKEEIVNLFSVNTERFDSYENFEFRVKWDGTWPVSARSALRGAPPT